MRTKFLLLTAAVTLLIGVAQPLRTAAVTVSDEDEVIATVESVDQAQRTVLLRGPEGGLMTVVAGPEVRNLAQVKAGDQVIVRYREALAAELAKPGTTAPVPQVTERAERAPLGEQPRGAMEHSIKARVKITRIDPRHNLVSFIGPAQIERTTEVLDPEMQKFLRTLHVGDEVDLTYTEAVAVTVEPMKK
ncbi:MAG: hypothetical protein ACJ8AW_35645 [Rhodopila sp.]